jgi:hypothetical protein
MEITTLITFLIPFLPTLLKRRGMAVLDKATESAASRIGEAAFSKAEAVWGKLSPKIEANPGVEEAINDVANHPEDEDFQAALRVQLKKLLAMDEELPKEIDRILHEDGADGTSGTQIIQNVTGDRNRVTQAISLVNGGNVSGNIIDRGLTPAETARRVAAFESFVERKRQLWASLTPAEQAEHDEQFEALYKSLEASRK